MINPFAKYSIQLFDDDDDIINKQHSVPETTRKTSLNIVKNVSKFQF